MKVDKICLPIYPYNFAELECKKALRKFVLVFYYVGGFWRKWSKRDLWSWSQYTGSVLTDKIIKAAFQRGQGSSKFLNCNWIYQASFLRKLILGNSEMSHVFSWAALSYNCWRWRKKCFFSYCNYRSNCSLQWFETNTDATDWGVGCFFL